MFDTPVFQECFKRICGELRSTICAQLIGNTIISEEIFSSATLVASPGLKKYTETHSLYLSAVMR